MARPVIVNRTGHPISAVWRIVRRMIGRSALQRRFEEMKRQTVGPCGAGKNRESDDRLAAKLEELRRSFEGASELCYFHAELIVRIRRGIDVSTNWSTFSSLWEHESEYLCGTLNSRWLISALDTYADHGSPLQQARALIQIAFFNAVRLAETERTLTGAPSSRKNLVDLDRLERFELWDGVSAYNMRCGDMVWNMLGRMRRSLAPDPILSAIFEALLASVLRHDTLIFRVAQISEHPRKEIAPNSDS